MPIRTADAAHERHHITCGLTPDLRAASMLTVDLGRAVMTGVAVEMLFSVLETGRDGEWPGIGPFGTGSPPAAVPLDHGHSLVLTTGYPDPATVLGVPPTVHLRGQAARRTGVSATPR
jgi:hypothetical protein